MGLATRLFTEATIQAEREQDRTRMAADEKPISDLTLDDVQEIISQHAPVYRRIRGALKESNRLTPREVVGMHLV